MKRFVVTSIDNETGMEMILSDCSFNNAMYWLESQGFDDPVSSRTWTKPDGWSMYEYTFNKPYRRTFVYDEGRGYLLGD